MATTTPMTQYDNAQVCMMCSTEDEHASQEHVPVPQANGAANNTQAKSSGAPVLPAAGGATLPTVDTEAAPNDGDEQPAPTTSDPQPMPLFTLFGGARVRFHGLKKADYLNGALGFCMLPPADPNDRIRVLIASNGGIALVKRENLQRNEDERDGENEMDLTTCLTEKLGIDVLHGMRGLNANKHTPPATWNRNKSKKLPTARFSLLASLAPVVHESVDGRKVDDSVLGSDPGEEDSKFEYADITKANMCRENELLWMHALDDRIKRTVTVLVNADLLPWSALLEDGNLFWEIGFTDVPEWPEPDRWVTTVCNFLQLLAWEYTVLRPAKLHPTVRFDIVRDLFIREWQERSRRLGGQLWPLYFPEDAGSSAAHADAASVAVLSAYEEERNKQVLKNQAMLASLGITTLVQEHRRQLPAEKKAKDKLADSTAPGSAPTRASARVAAMPDRPQYAPEAQPLGSDEDGAAEEEDGEESDSGDHGSSDCSDSDASMGQDGDAEPGAAGCSRGGSSSKARRAPKATVKPKPKSAVNSAAQNGERRFKRVITRGKCASVPRGGRGFLCRHPGCDLIAETPDPVLDHARGAHGLEGREVVDGRMVRCLWDGCGKLVSVQLRPSGRLDLHNLRRHEDLHELGSSARGFLCPGEGCGAAFPTSDEAWACAETHKIDRDGKRCLWEGCGRVFLEAHTYQRHEPTHTNIWPYSCPSCGKGHTQMNMAHGCCVVGAACVCGWWSAESRGKVNNSNKLANHLRRCNKGATADIARVGSVVAKSG